MVFSHRPVLSEEVVRLLNCSPGRTYVDGTVGGGGHALEILRASGPDGRLVGIDRDPDALKAAAEALIGYKDRVTLVRENFKNISSVVASLGIKKVNGVVLDLGVSSYQFDEPGRGFSFRFDARLDMRMDTTQELTAYDVVNGRGFEELYRIFREYGEERFSKRIASAIVEARSKRPVETTGRLAEVVMAAVPKRFHGGPIHPATRVFQAIRIEVNDELANLREGIKNSIEILERGGRLAIISFHSLEDRMVKTSFAEAINPCTCPPRLPRCACGRTPVAKAVTKKAVVPGEEETSANPRSRSARLRAIEKIF